MPTPPRPNDPRPLSDEEERRLAELGRDLVADDPELAKLADERPPAGHSPLDVGLTVGAVLVILWVLLPSSWFSGVLLFALMTWPILLADHLLPWRSPRRDSEPE